MRQAVQHLELQNMDLKHKLNEVVVINEQASQAENNLKSKVDAL